MPAAKTYKTGVIITGDASGAVKASNLTEQQLEKLNATNKKTSKSFKNTASELRKVTAQAAKYGAAIAGAVVAATAAMVKNQLKLIDGLAKTSDKLGIATQNLASLRIQAELTDVASNTLDMGLQRMVRRVAEAAQVTGEAKDALKELGLNAQALAAMAPDKQFAAIADAMEGVESQSDRVRLAFKLFDSEGVALVNTLRGGSAAAQEAAEFAEQYGLALTRVDAAKIEQANDAWLKVSKASEGYWQQLTVQLAPALTGIAGEILGISSDLGTAQSQAESAFSAIAKGAGFVADAARGLQVVWKGLTVLVANWYALIAETFAGADRIITGFLNKLPAWMGGGGFTESQMLQDIAGSLRSSADTLGQELNDLVHKAMPSEVLKKKLKDWQSESLKAATAVKKARDEQEKLTKKAAAVEAKRAAALKKQGGDLVISLRKQVTEKKKEIAATKLGEKALKAYNKEQFVAKQVLEAKKTGQEFNLGMLQKEAAALFDLQQELSATQEAQKAAEEAAKSAAEESARAWEEATNRIDAAFADAWKGALHSFGDFRDRIKDALKNLMGELIHQATTKKILISVGLGGGSSGAAAQGNGLSSLLGNIFGGGSGGAGAAGGGGLGDLLGIGGTIAGINEALGYAGTSAMQFLADAGFVDAANGLGNYLTRLSDAPGGTLGGSLINAGAGIVGSYAGTKLGEGLFGKQAESSIGATAGSLIGSIWGPLGTAIGGAIGGLVDTAFGGDGKKRVQLGISTDPNVRRKYEVATASGASGLEFSAQSIRGGKQGTEAVTALLDQFVAIDNVLTTTLRSLGSDIDLSGVQLNGPEQGKESQLAGFFGSAAFNRIDQGEFESAASDFVVAWLDEVADVLPERMKRIIPGVEKSIDQLMGTVASVANITNLFNTDVTSIAAQQVGGSSLFDLYNKQTDAAIDLARAYDGNLDSLVAFEAALISQKDLALQLSVQVQQAAQSVQSLFGETRRSIAESLMSEEELYNSRRAQVTAMVAELQTSLDPARINQLSQQITQITGSAFSSLDGRQQSSLGGGFLQFIDDAEALAQSRLAEVSARVESDNRAIEAGFDSAVDALERVAQTQQEAADKQLEAANKLIELFGSNPGLIFSSGSLLPFQRFASEVNV